MSFNYVQENSPAFEGWDNDVRVVLSPIRDGRNFLSSLAGLEQLRLVKPSVETLGYCHHAFTQTSAT
jgi:hypothetical protein